MNKAVMAWIAIVALVVSLASTIIAIWFQCTPKNDLLDLTKLLLSWQVISGGLAAGAASTFHEEIRGLLKKI